MSRAVTAESGRLWPIYFLFLALTLQNLLLGQFAANAPRPARLWLLGFSALLPVMVCGAGALRTLGDHTPWRKDRLLHLATGTYLAYLLAGTLFSSPPFEVRLAALRNSTAFVFLLYSAYLTVDGSEIYVSKFLRLGRRWAVAVLSFGLLERFVLGDEFWERWARVGVVVQTKRLSLTGVEHAGAVPADFYTQISGQNFRRMASVFATPITAGYFLAAWCFLAAVGKRGVVRAAWLLVMGVGVLLTLSKGALQIVLAAGTAYVIVGMVRGVLRRPIGILIVVVGVASATTASVVGALSLPVGTTAPFHVEGLLGPLRDFGRSGVGVLLFGHGLGTGGSLGARVRGDALQAHSRGAESAIGSVLYQAGAFGVLLLLVIVVILLVLLARSFARCQENSCEFGALFRAVFAVNFALVVNAFLQENAFALIPTMTFALSGGLALRFAQEHECPRVQEALADMRPRIPPFS